MQEIKNIKNLVIYTNGERQWHVYWDEKESGSIKRRFIQEISDVNITNYKAVKEVVSSQFGIELPSKKEILEQVLEIIENTPKKKRNRLGYVDIYLIKDYQRI